MTRSELVTRIHVLLGRRVAEGMIFSGVSTGAQNDLQEATEIARTMVTQFGMSEKIGLVSFEGTPLCFSPSRSTDQRHTATAPHS